MFSGMSANAPRHANSSGKGGPARFLRPPPRSIDWPIRMEKPPPPRGVSRAGSLMTLSSLSTLRLEDAAAAATGPLWFQLYINKDRGFTRDLVQRAVAAGYKALVVTADTPRWGVRKTGVRNGFHLSPGIEPVNLMVSHEGSGALSHQGSGMVQPS